MLKRVFVEDIGTKLIDGEVYNCRLGDEFFYARFNYCPDEYWWTRNDTEKLTGVSEYQVKET
jgi:hypothetical protein